MGVVNVCHRLRWAVRSHGVTTSNGSISGISFVVSQRSALLSLVQLSMHYDGMQSSGGRLVDKFINYGD